MKRWLENLIGRARLDDFASIHRLDPVGDVAHDREIVGDEDIGDAERLLKLHEQVQDRRRHRDVECAHRLVADDHPG